jgi:hypothetical protein
MIVAASREKKRNDDDKKKLTKVLSTKITTEDHKKFRVLARLAYQYGGIKEDSPSEILRFIITSAVNQLRNQPGFSLI